MNTPVIIMHPIDMDDLSRYLQGKVGYDVCPWKNGERIEIKSGSKIMKLLITEIGIELGNKRYRIEAQIL